MNVRTEAQTVSLPILIWCVRNTNEEGEALLLRSRSEEAIFLRDPDSIPVRRFKDFKQALKRMGRGRGDQLVAMTLLRIAMASQQQEDIKKAREKLCAAVAYNHQLGKRLNRLLRISARVQRKEL
jgi:hypothetical protein